MKSKHILEALAVLGAVLAAGPSVGLADLYSFPPVESGRGMEERPRPQRSADPFVEALAHRMKLEVDTVLNAFNKGFGRAEFLRLVLIAQKSRKPLDDLLKAREEGARLAKLAESSGLKNREVRREALSILKELEKAEAEARKAEAERPTAGVNSSTSPKPAAGKEPKHGTRR